MLIATAQIFAATNYYVDSSNGNDGNDGLFPEKAWKTVGKVNNSMGYFTPGDSILFKRGCTFKGQGELYIEAGGSAGSYLTFGAFGSGAKPILDKVRCNTDNISYVAVHDLYIKDGNTGISFYGDNGSHITISRCEIDNMSNNGIFLKRINTYIIEDSTVTNCGNGGIGIIGSEFYKITNGIIRNNTIGNIRDNDGISLHKEDITLNECGSHHQLVNNVCYNCGENGIDITSGTHVILRGNETYGSGEGGILCGGRNVTDVWIDRHYSHDDYVGLGFGGNVNVKLTSSIIYNAYYHQLVIGPTTSCINFEGYHNTIVYGPDSTGLMIDINSNVHGVKFKNNIFTSTQYGSPKTYVRYVGGATPSSTNSDFDYNTYWRSDNDNSGRWNVGGNISWFSWQSTWNQDTYSYWSNPDLVNPGNKDFHLQENSPCVDTGIDVGVTRDFEGISIPQGLAPDRGACECEIGTPLNTEIDASPTSGVVPLTVNFTGSATGGTSPYSYTWDFGDGASSNMKNPTHTYSQAGDFTATLTVTDSKNNNDTKSIIINAVNTAPLTAAIVTSPTSGVVPLTVNFTGFATGGKSPYSYTWDFGDGASSNIKSPSHTYSQAGDFTATLTVTDSASIQDSASVTINVTATAAETNLIISSSTGAPAPGQGGTTNPSPGNHSYSFGRSVQLRATPNTHYRFSKWTGDINDSVAGNKQISVTMDKNKSISALFCTKCGDVNGDLNISPLDSQAVFDIFLGKMADPTECQKENADVNSDGTKTEPCISPADAQAIFVKFLGKSELPSDCSCNSRAGTLEFQKIQKFSTQESLYQEIIIIINSVEGTLGEEIVVPVFIDNPYNIDAFGFDLIFPSESLEFIGVGKTELVKDFYQVNGNEIQQGILRVGGYSSKPINSASSGVLVTLIFRVIKETSYPIPLFITKTFDDLKNASVNNFNSNKRRTKIRKNVLR